MKFEVGQKWKTRNGRTATISSLDGNGNYPMTGTISGNGDFQFTWTRDGIHSEGREGDGDLIKLLDEGKVMDQVTENKRRAQVMLAVEYDGPRCVNIEYRNTADECWSPATTPIWDWLSYEYRIAESVVKYTNLYASGLLGSCFESIDLCRGHVLNEQDLIDRVKITVKGGKAIVELIGLD